jgi:hypothetical protein
VDGTNTAAAVSKGIKYTIAATGTLAMSGAGALNATAAPVTSTVAHGVYDWNGWSFGFGGSWDAYRSGVSTDVYGTPFSGNLRSMDSILTSKSGRISGPATMFWVSTATCCSAGTTRALKAATATAV